jgi:hypothetical protein
VSYVQPPPDRALGLMGKAWLAAEIVADYWRVRRLLGRRPVTRILATLRGPSRSTAAPVDGRRLAPAVVRTLKPFPQGERCLLRSLVLLSVLARRGVASDLVIAVLPGDDLPLDAHAWVEIDGRALLAPAPDFGRLVTL